MTDWADLESPRGARGRVAASGPLVTIGTPRRELAYLNRAARDALGDPRFIRWQHGAFNGSRGDTFSLINADGESDEYIAAQTNSRRYSVNANGQVTCTPVLPLVPHTPVTLRLALHGERLVAVARVERT